MNRSFRKAASAVLISFTLAVPTTILSATPADAHTVPCVSKTEFRSVTKGMKMKRVHRIFDIRGKQAWFFSASLGLPAEQGRDYRACTHLFGRSGPHGWVSVDYKRRSGVWRVTSKTAFW